MNPIVCLLATRHHSQWTNFMVDHLFSAYQGEKLATQALIHPFIMSNFTWVCSFWVETCSFQTKKLSRGRSRFALLPKSFDCRTRS